MKIKILLFIFFYSIVCFGQRLTLNELQVFCNNKSWETTNKTLLAQKWDYYDSSQGDDEHYNIINWAYGRNLYNDSKATAWLYLYSYDGLPNKVLYRFRQKEYYNAIQSQIKSNGYKLTSENIFDSKVTVTYENSNYYLQLAYTREEDSEASYYSNSKSYTVYEVTVYKKGGVYDPDNGLKKEYDEDGNLTVEYTLKNGKLEGLAKSFNSEGKITSQSFFKDGLKEGEVISYKYIDDSELYVKTITKYKNGLLNGRSISYVITPEEKFIISSFNYKNDLLEGKAYSAESEKVKVMNFSNNKLNGNYKEYLDIIALLSESTARIDTLNLPSTLIIDQNYVDDKLNGEVKKFDIKNSLITEGHYKDSLKTGTWKYYYSNTADENGEKHEYAGKLYLIERYYNGKLNGQSEQFSYLDKIEIPCVDEKEEDCFKYEIVYLNLINHYKDDELDGEHILKTKEGVLISKGFYTKGLKTGKWIEYGESDYSNILINGRSYETGFYTNDKKNGKWERFDESENLLESYSYNYDFIDGKHTTFNQGLPLINRYFSFNNLKKVETLQNNKIVRCIEIIYDSSMDYKVKDIQYSQDRTEVITVKVIKENNFKIDSKYFSSYFIKLDNSKKIKDGLYELKTIDDKLVSTGEYDNNSKNGEWNDYYYDQNVKTTFKYKNGNLLDEYYFDLKKNEPFSGEFIFKDTENNITEERKIKNGKRHGTTRYKDQNDKTIRKESFKEGVLKE